MRPLWWSQGKYLTECRRAKNGRGAEDAADHLQRLLHGAVAVVADGEDVGRQLPDLLVSVKLDLLAGVDGEDLVGVHRHQDGASVGLGTGQEKLDT